MSLQKLQQHFKGRSLTHIVLDGWGYGKQDHTDAIFQAKLPTMDFLLANYAHTQLLTHGPHVGLPSEKDLGGSEVGHLTMGAGQVLEQGPTYIKRLIESGEFFKGETFQKVLQNCKEHRTPLHLIGLLSDGNIHSHIDHYIAIIQEAFRYEIPQLYLHALLDGRDVAIQSALEYVDQIEKLFHELKTQRPTIDYAFASAGGREVITMDRDQNWSKIEAGWNIHVRGQCEHTFESMQEAILYFRSQSPQLVDQAIPGFVLTREGNAIAPIADNHSVIFMNFRADRAIQFTRAMVESHFSAFDRTPYPNVYYASMTLYDEDNHVPENYLVGTTKVENPFGKRILERGMKQFRLTESQKMPHVTFFFNGGYREPLDASKENYCLIKSDEVDSFDQAPAMKATEIATKAIELIQAKEYHYGLINFANADMVGHSGNLTATITAVEAVDHNLKRVLEAVKANSGVAVITADHGNADQMLVPSKSNHDALEPDTKHSLNPVPFIIYDPLFSNQYSLKPLIIDNPLNLSQIAATNFVLLGEKIPNDLSDSLFEM